MLQGSLLFRHRLVTGSFPQLTHSGPILKQHSIIILESKAERPEGTSVNLRYARP